MDSFLCLLFLKGFLMFIFLNFFERAFFDKFEVDFFLYCPLPYSLPSGYSANLTARRFAPSLSYWTNIGFQKFGFCNIKIVAKKRPLLQKKTYGSSANLTARRFAPSLMGSDGKGWDGNQSVYYFFYFKIY